MVKNIIIVSLGTVILCFNSFYNKFPLLNENSATFIESAFNLMNQCQVIETYGFFIRQASLSFSIWLVVIAQAFTLSLMIFYCFKYFLGGKLFKTRYLAFVFFISFFMSASIGASTIGNALFLNTSILCLSLVVFAQNLSTRDLYIIFVVGLVSLCMDFINILFSLSVLLILIFAKVSKFHLLTFYDGEQRNLARVSLLVAASVLTFGSMFFFSNSFDRRNECALSLGQKPTELAAKNNAQDTNRSGNLFLIEQYPPTAKDTRLQESLRSWFAWEFRENMLSHQYRRSISFKGSSIIQIISAVICVLFIATRSRTRQPAWYLRFFLFYAACFLLCVVVAFLLPAKFSNSPSQIMWLLAQTAFLYVANNQPNRQYI